GHRVVRVSLRPVWHRAGGQWIDDSSTKRWEESNPIARPARVRRGRWKPDYPDRVRQRRRDCVVNTIGADPVPMREVRAERNKIGEHRRRSVRIKDPQVTLNTGNRTVSTTRTKSRIVSGLHGDPTHCATRVGHHVGHVRGTLWKRTGRSDNALGASPSDRLECFAVQISGEGQTVPVRLHYV